MSAYTREHMAVSGGVVKQSEVPHALLQHPVYGLFSVTQDGNYWWVRFQRPVPADLESQFRTQGWWYSDRKGTGRKGWWTDTQRNPNAGVMLSNLGVSDVPDLSQVVRVKPAPAPKASKPVTPKAAAPATGKLAQATKSMTTSDGTQVHWNGWRWVDANGRFVKNPTKGKAQPVQVQAKSTTVLPPVPVEVEVAVASASNPQVPAADKKAMLEYALLMQAQLIDALSKL
jgi:hypothetical protein